MQGQISREITRNTRTRQLLTRVVVLATLTVLAVVAPAQAETLGAGYTSSPLAYGNGTNYSCQTWSGDADASGNIYIPCFNYIYKLDPSGRLVHAIRVPDGYQAWRDVAPTWDGSTIYYVVGVPDVDNPPAGTNQGMLVKLVLGADGVYRRDTKFAVGPFMLGATRNAVRNVAVDHAGKVYVTSNAYVFIYNSVGTRLGVFGGDDRVNDLEEAEVLEGIAVNSAGTSVYVVEERNNHVQRWDRTATGAWLHSNWRLGTPYRGPGICDATHFAAPYDVALDGGGNIYVLDTTCGRIHKFVASSRALVGVVRSTPGLLYHGLAVNYRGDVVVPWQGRRYTRTGASVLSPSCLPDFDAPVITQLSKPSTTWQRSITLKVRGTDQCSGVRAVRVTGNVTSSTAWRTLRSTTGVVLRSGDGTKTLNVSIRDGYGRITTRVVTVRLDTSQPPLRARRHVRIAGHARFCRPNPMSRISNARQYVLTDACATFGGTVVSIARSGSTRFVRVRLTLRGSRKLYSNARHPVTIYVVGSRHTPTGRALRVGRHARFTASLIANRRLTTATAIPVYRWGRG
jgi:hypothetical protein